MRSGASKPIDGDAGAKATPCYLEYSSGGAWSRMGVLSTSRARIAQNRIYAETHGTDTIYTKNL